MSEKTPEQMTIEELRQLALDSFEKPLTQQTTEPAKPAKPTVAAAEEEEEAVEEVDEIVYRRVIDLKDGSGVQVFEAPTMDELLDKLAVAQENATRKIREQALALKEKQTAPKQLTPEERLELQQRMVNDPDAVINEKIEEQVEAKYGERLKKLEAIEKVQEGERIATEWVDSNADYFASPRNGERMKKYLATYNMDITPENLKQAFEDLNASGLLESRPAENTEQQTEPEVKPAKTERIVESAPAVTTVRRKVVGGISTKRQTPVASSPQELTEEELRKMPMDKFENMMYEKMLKGEI